MNGIGKRSVTIVLVLACCVIGLFYYKSLRGGDAYNVVVMKSLKGLIGEYAKVHNGDLPDSMDEIYKFELGAESLRFRGNDGSLADWVIFKGRRISALGRDIVLVSPISTNNGWLALDNSLGIHQFSSDELIRFIFASESVPRTN